MIENRLSAHYFTRPKPDNEVWENGVIRENEDAILPKTTDEYDIYAISDGAGGSGLFAKEWANAILHALSDQPISSAQALHDLILSITENFYAEMDEKIGADTFKRNKFYKEGSCATLAAIWIHKTDLNYHWCTYGDSCFFEIRENKLLMYPYEKLADFEKNPYLLNWNDDKLDECGFKHGKANLAETKGIGIASDALSQFILMHKNRADNKQAEGLFSNLKSFFAKHQSNETDFWADLSACENQEKFDALTEEWYQNGFLPKDDYAFVWISSVV